MAKYVLLVFDEDEAADAFVHLIEQDSGPAWKFMREQIKPQVRGIFKKPTKFCECTRLKGRGFFRGKKWGWWVCSQCGRPTWQWASLNTLYGVLGFNLLPKSAKAPEYRGDGDWLPHHPDKKEG
jgi:hypothetical protein